MGNQFMSWGLDKTLAHALAGGVTSTALGGDFQSGFLSAGFAELAGPMYKDLGAVGEGVARAVVGGTMSQLGGGKFANGALSAAYGYLFNHCSHGKCDFGWEQALYDWMPGYKAGTLLYNQTMGDGSWTWWEVLDAASIGTGVLGRGLQLLSPAARLSGLGYDANKLNHIFGNADHMMGPLVQQSGSVERAMLSIDKAAQTLMSNQAALQRGSWINVQGNQVWVRGAVVNDRVRIGTASMNSGR